MITPFPCKRLLGSDGSFDALYEEWAAQVRQFEGDIAARYAIPYMDHARKIAFEEPPSPNYGVFALHEDGANHALFHANVAGLPGTAGNTLRLLWVLLAPIYDYEDRSQDEIARITSSLIHQSIGMCQDGPLRANHLKIHLQNVGDRRLAIGLAMALREMQSTREVGVRGNWLHFDNVS